MKLRKEFFALNFLCVVLVKVVSEPIVGYNAQNNGKGRSDFWSTLFGFSNPTPTIPPAQSLYELKETPLGPCFVMVSTTTTTPPPPNGPLCPLEALQPEVPLQNLPDSQAPFIQTDIPGEEPDKTFSQRPNLLPGYVSSFTPNNQVPPSEIFPPPTFPESQIPIENQVLPGPPVQGLNGIQPNQVQPDLGFPAEGIPNVGPINTGSADEFFPNQGQSLPNQGFPQQFLPSQGTQNIMSPDQLLTNQGTQNLPYPDQYIPNQESPEQFLPNQGTQNLAYPDQLFPNQVLPEQILPNQQFPDQFPPNQGIPNYESPDQFFPNQGSPEQFVPNQGISNLNSPNPFIPNEGPSDQLPNQLIPGPPPNIPIYDFQPDQWLPSENFPGPPPINQVNRPTNLPEQNYLPYPPSQTPGEENLPGQISPVVQFPGDQTFPSQGIPYIPGETPMTSGNIPGEQPLDANLNPYYPADNSFPPNMGIPQDLIPSIQGTPLEPINVGPDEQQIEPDLTTGEDFLNPEVSIRPGEPSIVPAESQIGPGNVPVSGEQFLGPQNPGFPTDQEIEQHNKEVIEHNQQIQQAIQEQQLNEALQQQQIDQTFQQEQLNEAIYQQQQIDQAVQQQQQIDQAIQQQQQQIDQTFQQQQQIDQTFQQQQQIDQAFQQQQQIDQAIQQQQQQIDQTFQQQQQIDQAIQQQQQIDQTFQQQQQIDQAIQQQQQIDQEIQQQQLIDQAIQQQQQFDEATLQQQQINQAIQNQQINQAIQQQQIDEAVYQQQLDNQQSQAAYQNPPTFNPEEPDFYIPNGDGQYVPESTGIISPGSGPIISPPMKPENIPVESLEQDNGAPSELQPVQVLPPQRPGGPDFVFPVNTNNKGWDNTPDFEPGASALIPEISNRPFQQGFVPDGVFPPPEGQIPQATAEVPNQFQVPSFPGQVLPQNQILPDQILPQNQILPGQILPDNQLLSGQNPLDQLPSIGSTNTQVIPTNPLDQFPLGFPSEPGIISFVPVQGLVPGIGDSVNQVAGPNPVFPNLPNDQILPASPNGPLLNPEISNILQPEGVPSNLDELTVQIPNFPGPDQIPPIPTPELPDQSVIESYPPIGPELPGSIGLPEFPGQGGLPQFPGQGGLSEFPGQGGLPQFPAQGGFPEINKEAGLTQLPGGLPESPFPIPASPGQFPLTSEVMPGANPQNIDCTLCQPGGPNGISSQNFQDVAPGVETCAGLPPGPFVPPGYFPVDNQLQQERNMDQCGLTPITPVDCSMTQVFEQLRLRVIYNLIIDAGLEKLFTQTNNYTFFAPVDNAFDLLPNWFLQSLRTDKQLLVAFITNHIIKINLPLESLGSEFLVMNFRGSRVRINVYNQDTDYRVYTVDGSRVLSGDIKTTTGLLHIVDKVVMPIPKRNLAGYLGEVREFSNFFKAVSKVGMLGDLDETIPYTLFIPVNSLSLENFVNRDDIMALRNFVNFHMVNGTYFSAGLVHGQYLVTNYFKEIKISVSSEGYQKFATNINGLIRIIKSDIPVLNGVAHVIETSITDDMNFFMYEELSEFSMEFSAFRRKMVLTNEELAKDI